MSGLGLQAILLGAASWAFSMIPWAAIFILTRLVGFGLYTVVDSDTAKRIQRRLVHSSHVAQDGKALGYAVGRWFALYIDHTRNDCGDRYTVSILATAASFARLTAEEGCEAAGGGEDGEAAALPNPKKVLTIWQRTGSYFNPYYRKRTVALPAAVSRDGQQAVMEQIIAHQTAHDHTVAFIHGPPGTGKSMLGLLLANHYEGPYCNSLKPWEPGNYLGELYADVEPTREKPLVIAFDEVDGALVAIHAGVAPHKNLPIAVPNKAGWNQFLDEIGRGMYPHIIVLMTSNRSPEFVRGLDPSYIRAGRVNICAELA